MQSTDPGAQRILPFSVSVFSITESLWGGSPGVDGGKLFTVTVTIERRSKRREPVWQPHGGETMFRAVFSPDGTRFARPNHGEKVHVHETATGNLLHTFQGRTPTFSAVALKKRPPP